MCVDDCALMAHSHALPFCSHPHPHTPLHARTHARTHAQVSLRQQVRDLETQLAQLKSYQREQATKLGAVVADKEALQIERTHLMGGVCG